MQVFFIVHDLRSDALAVLLIVFSLLLLQYSSCSGSGRLPDAWGIFLGSSMDLYPCVMVGSMQLYCSLLLTSDCVELCAMPLISKWILIWRKWKLLLPLRESKQRFQTLLPPQWATTSSGPVDASRSHFRRTRISRPPLDEWSARCRDLCLTRHNNHERQMSMPRRDSNS